MKKKKLNRQRKPSQTKQENDVTEQSDELVDYCKWLIKLTDGVDVDESEIKRVLEKGREYGEKLRQQGLEKSDGSCKLPED